MLDEITSDAKEAIADSVARGNTSLEQAQWLIDFLDLREV
jgi:hypothetical protein